MRCITLFVFALFWTSAARAQQTLPLSADSIQITDRGMDTVPQTLMFDTLLKKKPLKLYFPDDRVAGSSADKSHMQAGVNYQTDDVYNGRKGNRVIPLVTPEISYVFKNGLQTDISVGYDIHDPSPQVNQYTFDVSYNFSPGNGNYSSSLTASVFFYNQQSESTTSEQNGSIEFDNSYDFNIVNAGLYLSWTYGGGKDYAATLNLQHEFDFKNGKLNITPALNMNAGTQNYYDSYYHHRKYRISKKGQKPVYEEVEVHGDVLNAGKFQLLDYEFSAPINYSLGRWTLNLTPTYALPVNPADILVTTSYKGSIISTKLVKEKLSNSFYAQLGFTYSF